VWARNLEEDEEGRREKEETELAEDEELKEESSSSSTEWSSELGFVLNTQERERGETGPGENQKRKTFSRTEHS
jgi:hypothetical protein